MTRLAPVLRRLPAVAAGWTLATCTPVGAGPAAMTPAPTPKAEPGDGIPEAPGFAPEDALAAPLDEGEALYLAAHESLGEGDRGSAVEALARLRALEDHPLAPWASTRLARVLLDTDPDAALRVLEDAPAAEAGWPGGLDDRWTRAEAHLRAGRPDEARAAYEALLDDTPPGSLATTSIGRWAAHLATSDAISDRVEALRIHRRIAAGSPQRAAGRRAGERADALHRGLPPARRRRTPAWTPEEHLLLGIAERRRTRSRQAVAAIRKAIDGFAAAHDLPGECTARLELGRTLERSRDRARAADELEGLLGKSCTDPDVLAQARFLAGRARARSGSPAAGRGHYEALVAAWPSHRLADDAALKAALLATPSDPRARSQALAAVAERFPAGDVRSEARFRAALLAAQIGDVPGALELVEDGIDHADPEEGEDVRGRLAYWRGRLLARLGRLDAASAALRDLGRAHPLGYYGQRAIALLDEVDAEAGRKLRAWIGEGRGWSEDGTTVLPAGSYLDDPRFRRATALLRVGDRGRARRELGALGRADGDGDGHQRRYAVAALLLAAGDVSRATRMVRRSFPTAPPVGAARALWRLAYPRAWAPQIEEAAAGAQVPPTLVRAVAREESGFAPGAISPARAYGLLQIIRPTARPIARELGLPSGPRALRRPEVNLRIGAALLAKLVARYEPNPGLVPAAYNAGAGATDRWLEERGDVPFDLWVETIPYDETRRYTRRVLQSWGIYALLDEGRLPRLPSTLP